MWAKVPVIVCKVRNTKPISFEIPTAAHLCIHVHMCICVHMRTSMQIVFPKLTYIHIFSIQELLFALIHTYIPSMLPNEN